MRLISISVFISVGLTYFFVSTPIYVALSFDMERDPRAANYGRIEFEGVEKIPEILNILERHNATATFFISGIVAERFPEVLKEIDSRGHELAVHGGYEHDQKVAGLPKNVQKAIILDTKQRIENITGKKVFGYRAPGHLIDADTLLALEELGFEYDSTVVPSLAGSYLYGHALYALEFPYNPDKKNPFVYGNMCLREIPLTPVFLNGNIDSLLAYQGTAITKFELLLAIIKLKLKNKPLVIYLHPGMLANLPNKPVNYRAGEHLIQKFEDIIDFMDAFNARYTAMGSYLGLGTRNHSSKLI